jgi:hypothetical protein
MKSFRIGGLQAEIQEKEFQPFSCDVQIPK